MPELLGIDDRADRLDLAVGDVHRHDVDQLPIGIEELGSRLPVHRHAADLKAADPLREPAPVAHHLGGLGAAVDRVPDRRSDSASRDIT